jgi:TolB-like protein/DNA-binding winged helix-turn-helix (wHTH) protein
MIAEATKAEFAGIQLDLSSGELTKDDRLVRLQGQPFLILRILLEHAGEVVTREELQRQLWPQDTYVDFDQGLNKAIARLRDTLDHLKAVPELIQTIPRRGYRINAEVDWIVPQNKSPNSRPEVLEVPARPKPAQPQSTRIWIAAGTVFTLILLSALWLYRPLRNWLTFQPPIQSVAVLPLVNISNDPSQDYLADGITEELRNDLSYAKSLRVISYASTISYKKSPLSVPQITQQLGVDAVIEGTVLRAENTIRITLRLIAVKPERQLWAASYEREASNIVALQKQIAADAVYQIRAQITPEDRNRLNLESKINPEAYDEYLRARFLLTKGTGQKDRAVPYLDRAIQLDPNFAAAYAALGEAWVLEGVWGTGGVHEVSAKALENSQKAVSLDPNSSEAYASLGFSLMHAHRWNDGEIALRRAIQLDPNNSNAIEYLSILLAQKGHAEESVALARELAIANPIAIEFQSNYAILLYRARRYAEAIEQSERTIHLDPNYLALYNAYANALVETGRYKEAEVAYAKGGFMNSGVRAWLYAREGDFAAAGALLKANPSLINPHSAVTRYLLGEKERGLAELDVLANERWAIKTYNLRNDPTFDPMRDDPRFDAIVKKTGLYDN